jgi:hypothetical protein
MSDFPIEKLHMQNFILTWAPLLWIVTDIIFQASK